jgi:hypothetical protein
MSRTAETSAITGHSKRFSKMFLDLVSFKLVHVSDISAPYTLAKIREPGDYII